MLQIFFTEKNNMWNTEEITHTEYFLFTLALNPNIGFLPRTEAANTTKIIHKYLFLMNSIKFVSILLENSDAHLSFIHSSIHSSLCKVLESCWANEATGGGTVWLSRLEQVQKASCGQVYIRTASAHRLPHHCFLLDYKKDPYSKGDPCNTICCREDLNSLNPSPGGCYDTKVTCSWLLNLIFTCI